MSALTQADALVANDGQPDSSPINHLTVSAPRPGRGLLLPALLVLILAALTLAVVWPRLQSRASVRVHSVALVPPSAGAADTNASPQAQSDGTGASESSSDTPLIDGLPVKLALPDNADPAFQSAGWIEADPLVQRVTALQSGIVSEVLVLEGDVVSEGQVLARLVDEDASLDLTEAEAALRQAQAEGQAAQAALVSAQTQWNHPLDLDQRLHHARHLVDQREAEITELDAQIVAATARLDELNDQSRRTAALGNEIPQQDQAQDRLRVTTQAARIAVMEARRPVLQAQLGHAAATLVNVQEELRLRTDDLRELDAARARAARAQAAVEVATTRRDRAQLAFDRCEIVSPTAGVVQRLYAFPGRKQMLGSDAPISVAVADIYKPGRIQVRVDVPLVNAGQLRVGMVCRIESEMLPGMHWVGQVTRIVGEADIQRNTVQAKVVVQDPDARLRPNVLMRVAFFAKGADGAAIGTRHNEQSRSPGEQAGGGGSVSRDGWQVFVPEDSLLEVADEPDGAVAFVVVGRDQRLERRTLQLGRDVRDGWRHVHAGLNPGDRVVHMPGADLTHGARVRILSDEVQ